MQIQKMLSDLKSTKPEKNVFVVATGITSAFIGDDRNLREYIVGNFIVKSLEQLGAYGDLLLINDSYDPLKPEQIHIAVSKDSYSFDYLNAFCGHPIAEIPDFFNCHESYAEHNISLFLDKLYKLNIFPKVIDSYKLYRRRSFDRYIEVIFKNYEEISQLVNQPFRIHCLNCGKMNTTKILAVDQNGQVKYECIDCHSSSENHYTNLNGKLSWKVHCAARWALFDIDIEPFSDMYLAPTGSYNISKMICEKFFMKPAAIPIRLGQVKITSDIPNGNLLSILPPTACKKLLLANNISSDISIDRYKVIEMAKDFPIREGLSFYKFAQQVTMYQTLTTVKEIPSDNLGIYNCSLNFSDIFLNDLPRLRIPDDGYINQLMEDMITPLRNLLEETIRIRMDKRNLDMINGELRKTVQDICAEEKVNQKDLFLSLRLLLTKEAKGPSLSILEDAPLTYLQNVLEMLKITRKLNGSTGEDIVMRQ